MEEVPSDFEAQREVQVQVISYPHLQTTAGPEQDLFMNQQRLQPSKHREFEDDFEVRDNVPLIIVWLAVEPLVISIMYVTLDCFLSSYELFIIKQSVWRATSLL